MINYIYIFIKFIIYKFYYYLVMIYKLVRGRCEEKLWTRRKIRAGKCGMVTILALLQIELKKKSKSNENKKQINIKNTLTER